ncbi:hypothetical protein Tco_0261279 [Tanacetum coccineum]
MSRVAVGGVGRWYGRCGGVGGEAAGGGGGECPRGSGRSGHEELAGGSCKDDDDGVVGDEGVVGCASVVVGWQRAAGRRSAGAASDIGRREGERQVPHKGVKASANSDVMCFFTSAQDGDPSQDDVRLCLGDG